MLVSDAVFLLLTTDEGGIDRGGVHRKAAIAGAAVVDLLAERRVEVSERRNPLVTVVNPAPIGHAAVDTVLASLAKRPRKLSSILMMPGGNVAAATGRELVDEGVLEERSRMLIGPAFPTINPGPEQHLRDRIRTILNGTGPRPELADAALLALFQGAGVAYGVLREERGARTRAELRQDIDHIVEEFPFAVSLRTVMKNYVASASAAASS